jgi:hypothetical protein
LLGDICGPGLAELPAKPCCCCMSFCRCAIWFRCQASSNIIKFLS